MNFASSTLPQLIADHQEALLDDWRSRLSTEHGGLAAELQAEMNDLLEAQRQVLLHPTGGGNAHATEVARINLESVLRNSSQLRAARGQTPEASVQFVQSGKDALLALLGAHAPADTAEREQTQHALSALTDRCVLILVSQFVATREAVIRNQAQSLLDMSTPVITLWESILLLPLVGIVDSVRAVQIAERLLETIGRTEAEITLIDVTGVPIMDTSVARHLLRTVAAAEMLGSRVILTGISPTTAQTMVKLGIDMSSVPTRGSLRAGVALALSMTGRQIGSRAAKEA
jgi:rsbT co-antagonist protein RsbR